MIRILYFSNAKPGITPSDVNKIASAAAEANEQRNITGALAFNGNVFAQVLEGDADEITALMDDICADPRHTGVREVMRKDISERCYEGWGMKLVGGLEFDLLVDSMSN
jgi:hypothetical protein